MQARGFSLIEVIIVIVILGLLGGVLANMLSFPLQATQHSHQQYAQAQDSHQILSQLNSELQSSVPGQVRILNSGSQQGLEFLYAIRQGRYRQDAGDGSTDILEFPDPDGQFDVLGGLQSLQPINIALRAGSLGECQTGVADCVVIPSVGLSAYQGQNIGTFSGLSSHAKGALLSVDNSGGAVFTAPNTQHQVYIANTAISYVCDTSTNTLTRYNSYGILSSQSLSPSGSGQTLSNDLESCTFQLHTLPDGKHMLDVRLNFQTNAQAKPWSMFQQIPLGAL